MNGFSLPCVSRISGFAIVGYSKKVPSRDNHA